MDGTTGKPDGAGTHIWLRYATQFTLGERTHTIEMGVPVPVGASAETRERLFREAEAGLDQLARHVENRVAQVQQRRTSSSQSPTTPAKSPVQPLPPAANKPSSPPAASHPAPSREVAERAQGYTRAPNGIPPQTSERKDMVVPPTRLNVGASMPSTPGVAGDRSERLELPQFIRAIKETLGLTGKQAMDLLKVKTLSGLNLREALEQLQQIVTQETATNTELSTQQAGTADRQREQQSGTPGPGPAHVPASSPAAPNLKIVGIKEITHAVVRELPPASTFDEEIDLDIDEDDAEEVEFLPELTDQERAIADYIFSKPKEARYSPTPSDTLPKCQNMVINKHKS